MSAYGQSGASVLVIVVSALLVAAVGMGIQIPVIGNGRAAFFTLAAMGWVLCQLIFRNPQNSYPHGWLNPFTVTGIVIGVANLLVIAAVLFRAKVPFIATDRAATLLLGALMGAQVVLAALRSALR